MIIPEGENQMSPEEVPQKILYKAQIRKKSLFKLQTNETAMSNSETVSEGKKTKFQIKNTNSNPPKLKVVVISKQSTGSKNVMERSSNRSVDKKVGDASSGKRADSAQSAKSTSKNGPSSILICPKEILIERIASAKL